MNQKAVFLDRDGVVVKPIARTGLSLPTSPFSLAEFQILPQAKESLDLLKHLGLLRILVTNQPDVRKGNMALSDWLVMQDRIRALGFDDIFVCPHLTKDNCFCKKPKPGLFLKAAQKWRVDLSGSYVIGDMANDMLAAKEIYSRGILISTAYNQDVESDYQAVSLWEAVTLIKTLEQERSG